MILTRKKKNCSGFTLIEMLTVVGMIAIISGVVIVGMKPADRKKDLIRMAEKTAFDLRRAQSFATQSKQSDKCLSGASDNKVLGWGLNFKQNDSTYDMVVKCEDGGSQIVETMSFMAKGVKTSASMAATSVIFYSPLGMLPSGSDITITLGSTALPNCNIDVGINSAGNINIGTLHCL